MKIKTLLIVTILLQLFAVSSFAQEVESIMIDSFSYTNREDMMARVDNFTVEMQNKPSAKGYISIKGSKSFRSSAEKEIKGYLKMRAFDMKNVVFQTGEGEKTAEVKLWLVPPGAKPPAQEKSVNRNNSVESQIIALEKAAWNAWKNKDSSWFQKNLADDALSVNSGGVFDKAQIIKGYSECDVKSYSLDDFKFRMLDKNVALITFTGNQNAVCGGEKNPTSVRVTSIYVKRDGKWLNSFYMETAIK